MLQKIWVHSPHCYVRLPELLSKLLCQLVHDGVTVVLDPLEGGQVAVLLQHTAGAAVRSHCLSIGLQLQTLI